MTSNAALFFESLVNVEHRLCGLKLKPLSLFHFLWLEHFNSPLLSNERRIELRDLELAAVICSSQESADVLRKLKRPAYLWHWFNRRRNAVSESKAWLAYFNDYFSIPEFWGGSEGGEKKKEANLPWLILCASAVVRETGWQLEKVLTLPVGLVIWLNVSFGFLNSGESKIISDADRYAMSLSDSRG